MPFFPSRRMVCAGKLKNFYVKGRIMSKRIQIRIMPDGSIQAKTIHIKGKQCLKVIKPLEQLLEAETVSSDFTEEYYETEAHLTTETRNQEVLRNGG